MASPSPPAPLTPDLHRKAAAGTEKSDLAGFE